MLVGGAEGEGSVPLLGAVAFVAVVSAASAPALGASLHDVVLEARAVDGRRLPGRVHVVFAVPGAVGALALGGGRGLRVTKGLAGRVGCGPVLGGGVEDVQKVSELVGGGPKAPPG